MNDKPWRVYILSGFLIGRPSWWLIGRYRTRATARRERTKAARLCWTDAVVLHEDWDRKLIEDVASWKPKGG